MPQEKTSIRFWWITRMVLGALFILVSFSKGSLPPGLVRGYGFDVVVPAFLFVEARGLYAPGRANFWNRLIGCSPERAAFVAYLISALSELGQYFKSWTHLPGVFDPSDLVAYAVGIGVVYAIDKLLHRQPPDQPDVKSATVTG